MQQIIENTRSLRINEKRKSDLFAPQGRIPQPPVPQPLAQAPRYEIRYPEIEPARVQSDLLPPKPRKPSRQKPMKPIAKPQTEPELQQPVTPRPLQAEPYFRLRTPQAHQIESQTSTAPQGSPPRSSTLLDRLQNNRTETFAGHNDWDIENTQFYADGNAAMEQPTDSETQIQPRPSADMDVNHGEKRQSDRSSDKALSEQAPQKKEQRKLPSKPKILPTTRQTRGAGASPGFFKNICSVLENPEGEYQDKDIFAKEDQPENFICLHVTSGENLHGTRYPAKPEGGTPLPGFQFNLAPYDGTAVGRPE